MLHIRHSKNRELRGIERLVTENEVHHVFIDRHILVSIGLNNQTLLAAAADRFGSLVEV